MCFLIHFSGPFKVMVTTDIDSFCLSKARYCSHLDNTINCTGTSSNIMYSGTAVDSLPNSACFNTTWRSTYISCTSSCTSIFIIHQSFILFLSCFDSVVTADKVWKTSKILNAVSDVFSKRVDCCGKINCCDLPKYVSMFTGVRACSCHVIHEQRAFQYAHLSLFAN